MKAKIIFFDIGQTLITGAGQSPRRLLGGQLGLSEKETKRVGQVIMTQWAEEPWELAQALAPILPGRDPVQIRAILETIWKEQRECVREIPGATPLLRALKADGYLLGLISNIWHPFYEGFCIACPEMAGLVDYRVLSYREGQKKPSANLYGRALVQACEPATSCWMVGDTYELDMQPAQQLGMRTLWVLCRPEREKNLLVEILRGRMEPPDWVVESLEEILPFFVGKGEEEC